MLRGCGRPGEEAVDHQVDDAAAGVLAGPQGLQDDGLSQPAAVVGRAVARPAQAGVEPLHQQEAQLHQPLGRLLPATLAATIGQGQGRQLGQPQRKATKRQDTSSVHSRDGFVVPVTVIPISS